MNILYTINSSQFGGTEVHVEDLIRGMYSRGHNVFVWCPPGDFQEKYEKAGAKVTIKKIEWDIDPLYIYWLAKFLKENKIDILHAHMLKSAVNSLLAGFLAGVKVRVSHTHTPISEWQISEFRKQVNGRIYSFFVNRLSTKEIALTQSRKTVKIKEGIDKNKLEIISNGLNVGKFMIAPEVRKRYANEFKEKYNLPDSAFLFGNLGRISKEKGTEVLIDGFARLINFFAVDSTLVIAGSGPLKKQMEQKALDQGLLDKVKFLGRIPDSDKIKFYSAIDMFIFPSLAEGFGIVLMEAMASGLPTVASNLEVLEEVGGSTVVFFETKDHKDLAQKMYNLFTKKDRLGILGKSAQKRVEELFTMDKFLDSYENLYVRLLEDTENKK